MGSFIIWPFQINEIDFEIICIFWKSFHVKKSFGKKYHSFYVNIKTLLPFFKLKILTRYILVSSYVLSVGQFSHFAALFEWPYMFSKTSLFCIMSQRVSLIMIFYLWKWYFSLTSHWFSCEYIKFESQCFINQFYWFVILT